MSSSNDLDGGPRIQIEVNSNTDEIRRQGGGGDMPTAEEQL